MTNQEAIEILKDLWRWKHPNQLEKDIRQALDKGIEALENQKSLGGELMKFRGGIADEQVLIGFNMAIAICNKYLGEKQ